MLRVFVVTSAAGLVFAPAVSAATVSFDPPEVTINVSAQPAIIDFDVILLPTQENESIDNFNLVIGSDSLTIASWEFDPAANTDVICDFGPCVRETGIYESDLLVGTFITRILVLPQRVGTLTVLVDGLSPGDYEFGIDTARDGFSNVGSSDVHAMATVRVIPEPATVVFLAFGLGVWVLSLRTRSRRTVG